MVAAAMPKVLGMTAVAAVGFGAYRIGRGRCSGRRSLVEPATLIS
jgi:hypothetical protein